MSQAKVTVFYHNPCMDGLVAAWAVHQYYYANYLEAILEHHNEAHTDTLPGTVTVPEEPEIEFIAAQYDKRDYYLCSNYAPYIDDRIVYVVDFSFTPQQFRHLAARAKEIYLFDHHLTMRNEWATILEAKERAPIFKNVHYAPDQSGALLTWKQLFGQDVPVPILVKHVSDRDLWQFKLPGTREFDAALRLHLPTMDATRETLETLTRLTASFARESGKYDEYLHMGETILAAREQMFVRFISKDAQLIDLNVVLSEKSMPERIPVPIMRIQPEFASDVGELLYRQFDSLLSITYWDDLDARVRKYSLRSPEGKGLNVAEIARRFGGGGHYHAAGFTQRLATFETHPFNQYIF